MIDRPNHAALQPGCTLGILGGGQLGRMLAMAGARLGVRTVFVSPDADPPAADVAVHIRGDYDDPVALAELDRRADVVTYEFENVDVDSARALATPVRPGLEALRIAQDRAEEKRALGEHGLPTAPWAVLDSAADITTALAEWGRCVVKTRRFGYDGKGQVVVDRPEQVAAAWVAMDGRPAIVEGWVDFACEASVIVGRDVSGRVACYDPVRNHHENNILRTSTVPAGLTADVERNAVDIAHSIARALDYVGVMGIELFIGASGTVQVNEIAPRVHNSGHWTIDACSVSQFEQHVRAVLGWPLGTTERHSDAVMENLLGAEIDHWRSLLEEPGSAVHIYRKGEARSARKMGHVTRISPRGQLAGM